MREVEKIVYVAFDNTEFDTAAGCLDYERDRGYLGIPAGEVRLYNSNGTCIIPQSIAEVNVAFMEENIQAITFQNDEAGQRFYQMFGATNDWNVPEDEYGDYEGVWFHDNYTNSWMPIVHGALSLLRALQHHLLSE